MRGKYERKRSRKRSALVGWLIALTVLLLVLVLGLLFLSRDQADPTVPPDSPSSSQPTDPEQTTAPPVTTEPINPVLSTASFTVTGDLLMHGPVFRSCWDAEAEDWIFDPVFAHVAPYIQAADYAVANLETTLCGEDNGYVYSGYPMFNCPDGIATASLNAGFDMLLTGNNHCYDTRTVGVRRTLEVLEQLGLESLGTQIDAQAQDYTVVEVNGIRVGMTAYTYETADGNPSMPSINAIPCSADSLGMINSFDYAQLSKFYEEIGAQFEAMKAEGAEAIVVYMHWGEEYLLTPTEYQVKIAQQLCDMGVDVIVGGHPHVVEPVDLLTSTQDENHRTLIIYSTGNALSNQRVHEMRLKTGHTEDGILFNFTLVKYADGTVELLETSCVPTWVYMEGNRKSYTILPLEFELREQWQETFGIGEDTYNACLASYDRTMALVSEGIEMAQSWFTQMHEAKVEELVGTNRNP